MSSSPPPAPKSPDELTELLKTCAAEGRPVVVEGGGSRTRVGRGSAPNAALAVDLRAFSGIVEYEPTELVITAGAATPLEEITRALAKQGQMLAFEPPDHADLCGRPGARPTLGGVLASNSSGPRRLTAGAARDHFLGFQGVSGRGDAFRAGGKVVKNVTGFDLSKVMAGSWGTLAVFTEVSVKVAPRPERSATLLISAEGPQEALSLMAGALGTAVAPTAAAFLPEPSARKLLGWSGGAACLRLEASEKALAARLDRLRAFFGDVARIDGVAGAEEDRLWTEISGVKVLGSEDLPLWRISLPAASAPELLGSMPPESYIADWAGNLVWLRAERPPELRREEGHVQYWGGAPSEIRVRSQLGAAETHLTRRLQAAFDPAGILNRDRAFPPQIEGAD